MSLDTTVYGILTASPAITAAVGTRIHPMWSPDDDFDRIVYQQIAGPRDHDCSGFSLARGLYQVTSWSSSYAGASALCEIVRSAIKAVAIGSTIKGVFIRNQGDVPSLDTDEQATQYGKYLEIEIVMKE